jgi:hypothetical protein
VSTLGPLLMEGRRPLARIAAFSLLPGLSLVSVVVVLPVLSARFGQAGWSSVLLGQSIGAAASVVCGLSWPLEGSNLASRTAPGQRLQMYRTSVRQRAWAVALAAPVMIAVAVIAAPSMPLVCALSAIAVSLNALLPTWYFVGVSRPIQSVVAEGFPRLVVSVLSIGLVALLPLWTYPVALICGMFATLAIAHVFIHRDAVKAVGGEPPRTEPAMPTKGRLPILAVVARGADAGYVYLSGPVIALVAAPAYPLYAAADRLAQSVVNLMGPATQGLTAWIGEGAPGQRRRRISGAVLVALGVAALAFLVLLVAGPLIVRFLFAGTIHIDRLVAFLIAAIVAGAFLARSLPLILLVPQDLARIAYRLMLLAAFLALPLLGVAAVVWGSVGALTVAAVAPWVVVAAQLTAGFRTSPRPTLLRG